jgi:hypothetical protein
MAIADCRIIDMPRIQDPRGNLTFVEGGQQIPFDIKRVYYLYDVPGGSERAVPGGSGRALGALWARTGAAKAGRASCRAPS